MCDYVCMLYICMEQISTQSLGVLSQKCIQLQQPSFGTHQWPSISFWPKYKVSKRFCYRNIYRLKLFVVAIVAACTNVVTHFCHCLRWDCCSLCSSTNQTETMQRINYCQHEQQIHLPRSRLNHMTHAAIVQMVKNISVVKQNWTMEWKTQRKKKQTITNRNCKVARLNLEWKRFSSHCYKMIFLHLSPSWLQNTKNILNACTLTMNSNHLFWYEWKAAF